MPIGAKNVSETTSRKEFGRLTADRAFGADFILTLLCRPNGKFDVEHDELDIQRSFNRCEEQAVGVALYSKIMLLDC